MINSPKGHAGIADAVSFVGLGHTFHTWDSGRFRARLTEATKQVRAFKKRLGFQRPEPDAGARE